MARENDWFGATVNLAARVSGAAAAGEVLLTDVTKLAARDGLGQIQLVPRDDALFKNVRRPVERWTAVPEGQERAGGRLEIDPV